MQRRILQSLGLVTILVVVNVWTMDDWSRWIGAPSLLLPGSYGASLGTAACWLLDGWLLLAIFFLFWRKTTLAALLRTDVLFISLTWVLCVLFMLATNPIAAGRLQGVRLCLPIMQVLLLTKLFQLKVMKAERGSRWARAAPIATSVATCLGLLIVLEGVFMFVAKSQLNDNSLSSKIWFARHWQLNTAGYRDFEPDADNHGRTLLFLGDSFLAGHGVPDTADRFSNRLQAQLGREWRVHNFGQNGANTEAELLQLRDCPFDPELVILCWYVNDIQEMGPRDSLLDQHASPSWHAHPFPISLIHGSYLFNYLYQLIPDGGHSVDYLAKLQRSYADSATMERYAQHLLSIRSEAMRRRARFAVVLFPMLNAVGESEFALAPMRKLWEAQGVPFLDLSALYGKYASKDLTVNASDAHPNEFAHQLAAKAIWEFIQQEKLLDKSP